MSLRMQTSMRMSISTVWSVKQDNDQEDEHKHGDHVNKRRRMRMGITKTMSKRMARSMSIAKKISMMWISMSVMRMKG